MDAADIDQTTYGLFKQKIMGDINTNNTTAQEETAALIPPLYAAELAKEGSHGKHTASQTK